MIYHARRWPSSRSWQDIPEATIHRRFDRSRLNLIRLLPVLTELMLYDNSFEADPHQGNAPRPTLVLHYRQGTILAPANLRDTPEWATVIKQGPD